MAQGTTAMPGDTRKQADGPSGPAPTSSPRSDGGFFQQYKPDQGKWTRVGTMLGAGFLVTWAAYFVYQKLLVYEGDDIGSLFITRGIPLVVWVAGLAVLFRVVFVSRKTSDFMIATEGEMKKVNWSSKNEVVGSTKVVIVVTLMMAFLLFFVDIIFQKVMVLIGVLKTM